MRAPSHWVRLAAPTLFAAGAAVAFAGEPLPARLSDTGLYAPGSTTQTGDGVLPYAPQYPDIEAGLSDAMMRYLSPGFGVERPKKTAGPLVSLGLSFRGLEALNVPDGYLHVFRRLSPAFAEGAPARAVRHLGDIGASAPGFWDEAFRLEDAHAVVTLHGTENGCETALAKLFDLMSPGGPNSDAEVKQTGDAKNTEEAQGAPCATPVGPPMHGKHLGPPPGREAIGQTLRHGYAHHIQRLMVTGNFALLAGVHPDAVEAWYLGIYIDAVQWVEMPNTRAMSQFADGGLVATKPYVSSANYIRRMSDYCGSCAYDAGKKHGEGACPFNSLYWDFYARHREKLASNPRIGMMLRTWERTAAPERKRILKQAESYRADLNRL